MSSHQNGWSLLPLTKIINAHTRLSRIIWSIFAVTMLAGLTISIILTIHQYVDNSTLFRMDYTLSGNFSDIPSITICHNAHRVSNETVLHSNVSESTISYNLPSTRDTKWSTLTAVSSFYRKLRNFSVQFYIHPPQTIELNVIEQFPRPKNQLCTVFQFLRSNKTSLNQLRINLHQPETPKPSKDFFELILHSKDSFPLNNYERFLYPRINPGKIVYVFISRSFMYHLNTKRNPCSNEQLEFMDRKFSYDQNMCQWKHSCHQLYNDCNRCACPLNILGVIHYPCPAHCLRKFSPHHIKPTVCPQACNKTKYTDLNMITNTLTTLHDASLVIFFSKMVSVATEEPIYSLPKMFSEIGGLSSLLFGVSCIIVFEIIEKLLHSVQLLHRPSSTKDSRSSDVMSKSKPTTVTLYRCFSQELVSPITSSSICLQNPMVKSDSKEDNNPQSPNCSSFSIQFIVDTLSFSSEILFSKSTSSCHTNNNDSNNTSADADGSNIYNISDVAV